MPAELGQTTDPKKLIPGDPEAVAADVRTAAVATRSIDRVSGGLAAVDPGPWTGDASQLFRSTFSVEPPKWSSTAQQLGVASGALAGYGETLQWAQRQAQVAIEKYTVARAASRAAAARYQAQTAHSGQGGHGAAASFHDPGAAGVAEAKEILEHARQRVHHGGNQVAGQLGGATDAATGKSGTDHSGGGSSPAEEAASFVANRLSIEGPTKTLFDHHSETSEAHGSTSARFGSNEDGGSYSASWGIDGSQNDQHLTVGSNGVDASACSESYSAKAQGNAEAHTGLLRAAASGHAFSGNRDCMNAHFGPDGANLGLDTFHGNELGGGLNVSAGGLGVQPGISLQEGTGASASVQAGMDHGKFRFRLSGGFAEGVGVKARMGFTVDPSQVADTAQKAGNFISQHGGSAIAHGAESVAHQTLNKFHLP